MQLARNFTVSPSSQEGEVYGTEFIFKAVLPGEYTAFAWTFGDGNIQYNKSTVSHTYNYPGIYTVNLSAWTDYGKLYVDECTVDVDYVYRDALQFTKIPELFNLPGITNYDPFVVSITSSKIDQPLAAYLHPHNTRSVPYYAVPTKWQFLTPKWSFTDASTDKVLKDNLLHFKTEPIYNSQNKIIAVKGEAAFYYTDDLSSGLDPTKTCPLLITATLSTHHFTYPKESLIYPYASYSNNEVVKTVTSWQIVDSIPTKLKVTENFINDIYPIKWAGVPIPVMVTMESDPALLDAFAEEEAIFVTTALGYPTKNEFGLLNPVILTLSASSPLTTLTQHFSVEPNLYFRSTDDYGNLASGYVFTSLKPYITLLTAAPDSTFVVLASTIATNTVSDVAKFRFPLGYPIRGNLYVSHPVEGNINNIQVSSYPKYCQTIAYYQEQELLSQGASFTFANTPLLTSTDIKNYTLSGAAAVYGIAFNPIRNRVYACDADQNTLIQYNSLNTALTSVQLSAIFKNEVLAPSYISIDRKYNVWVSLYDDYRIIKFNSNLKYLLSAAPTDFSGKRTLLSPPVVETDRRNEVWACWAHATSSTLVKFDQYGNQKINIQNFPEKSQPVSLAISPENGVWVACKQIDSVLFYNDQGTLLDTLSSGILRPSYIALDRNANLWIAHGYDLCSVYDTQTKEMSTWRFATIEDLETGVPKITSQYVPQLTEEDFYNSRSKDELWGGMSIDVFDRVWLIDSDNNTVGGFNTEDPFTIATALVNPQVSKMPVILGGDEFVSLVPATKARSAQAGGDWTGNRWYQKYVGVYDSLPVYGTSAPFKLYDLEKSFKVAKVNETFDFASYLKSLAIPEILSNNKALFEQFFVALVGDGNPIKEGVGRVVYERIANFVNTHGDLETAEIKQLLSFAESVAVEANNYGSNFPVAVERLINIFSIPKQNLRGTPKLISDIEENIGPLVTETSMITAGKYYFVKDKMYASYQLIYATPYQNQTIYPLAQFNVDGLRAPFTSNYLVFEYNDINSKGYAGNLLDWDSEYTSISYNLSTNEEWYGDGGLVETMFNNLLTKQLY